MTPRILFVFVTAALLASTPDAAAQQRKQAQNAAGKIYWQEFKAEDCAYCSTKGVAECRTCNGGRKKSKTKCGDCRGKKKSTCFRCYGDGKTPDPFERFACTRCDARGFVSCFMCGGGGEIKLTSGKKGPKCKPCKKKGGSKCHYCNGKRYMPILTPGGKPLASASLDELKKHIKPLQSIFDRSKKFLEDKRGKFYEQDYDEIIDKAKEFIPGLEKDRKDVRKQYKLALKHKGLKDHEQVAKRARTSAIRALNAWAFRHLEQMNACVNVHENNRRREVRKGK